MFTFFKFIIKACGISIKYYKCCSLSQCMGPTKHTSPFFAYTLFTTIPHTHIYHTHYTIHTMHHIPHTASFSIHDHTQHIPLTTYHTHTPNTRYQIHTIHHTISHIPHITQILHQTTPRNTHQIYNIHHTTTRHITYTIHIPH